MKIGLALERCRATIPTFYGHRLANIVPWSPPGRGLNRTVSQAVLGEDLARKALLVEQNAFSRLEMGLADIGLIKYSGPKAWVRQIAGCLKDLAEDLEGLRQDMADISNTMPEEDEFSLVIAPRLRVTESLLSAAERSISEYGQKHPRQGLRSQRAIQSAFKRPLAFFREYISESRRQVPNEPFYWRDVRFQKYCDYLYQLKEMSSQLKSLSQKMDRTDFYRR